METVTTIEQLESLYGEAVPAALDKVSMHITPLYRQWIEASRFLVLTSVGPDGTDGSPRGDNGPVVRIIDEKTIWLPDWRGNNRIDTLRNIVSDGRVSLMFMIPGCKNVVRINGTAVLSAAEKITTSFERGGKMPATVIITKVGEIYFQCAKALMRSKLWESGDQSDRAPTAGEFIREMKSGFDAAAYDEGYPEYAKERMW